jgi:hypothetical protein
MEPRKKKYDDKFIRKTIRFTEIEWQEIEEQIKKSEITFTEFARSAILRKKIKLPIEKELIYELNKIGNNLNQIAKAVNQRDDKIQILTELVEIERALKDASKIL